MLLRKSAASGAAAHSAPAVMLRTNNGKVATVRPVKATQRRAVALRPAHRRVAAHHTAPSIIVPLDEVRVVAFSQPISTVYVGNPMIADVSMIDSKHAFVLGKGFGHTNVVALDADGKQVVNDSVTVFGHTGSTVILHRGAAQTTYACAGARCESAPMPGDDKDSFSQRMEQMNAHQDAGVKAASATR
ncbi:MAG TPA: pilus assembly protein N-terminal domain-containing protein [Rhizomicrobium sp.]